MPAKGWPISLSGTIQNFEEGGCLPKDSQLSIREHCKILGKWLAKKLEGTNTKFLGRRTLAEGGPTSQMGTIQNFGEGKH